MVSIDAASIITIMVEYESGSIEADSSVVILLKHILKQFVSEKMRV